MNDHLSPLGYEPPAIEDLGTLAEMTLGGVFGGATDAFGGVSGSSGSL